MRLEELWWPGWEVEWRRGVLRNSVVGKPVLSPVLLHERHVFRKVVVHVELYTLGVEDGDLGRHFVERGIRLAFN